MGTRVGDKAGAGDRGITRQAVLKLLTSRPMVLSSGSETFYLVRAHLLK